MAVYLIDFENVTSAGISGIQRLSKEDKVYIFYTVNASNMSFAAHMNLLSSPAEVIYYNVTSGGKNALDFQLASFLGYLISKGEDKDFCIISNDKGYDHVKSFWERSGIAEGVTIHSAPSINRSLMPAEKPFTSKIQQAQGAQQTVAQQNGVSLEQLEQMKAETDRYTAQKKAAALAKEAASNEAISSENAEKANADMENDAPKAEKSQVKSEKEEKIAEKNEAAEEKVVKRRGRPRKQAAEVPEKAKKTEKNEEASANPEEAFANQAEILEEIEKEEKKPAKKAKATEKTAKAKSKEAAMKSLRKAIRPFLEKAGIKSDGDIINIANLLKSADGKQQFYCKLTKSYGMEKGLTAYKAVRTEYTNLTKLVKQ